MSIFFSKLISLLLHPLFMPMLALCIVIESNSFYSIIFGSEIKQSLYILFLLLTVLMPLISMIVLVRNRFVSGFHMPNREERFMPYIQSAVYFGMLYYYLRVKGLNGPFCAAVLGSITVLVLMTIINVWIKISAHTSGIAGVAGIVAGMMSNNLLYEGPALLGLLIVLTGLTATARMSLGAHKPIEIYAGLVLGFFTEYLMVSFDVYI
ncbi:MAG: hypothetical protein ACHQF2_02295 [Flavobacteriales bacterium]